MSDHWVRSPLLNIHRACQTCHRVSEQEIAARVDAIQSKNYALLQRGGAAIVDLIDGINDAKARGATAEQLRAAQQLQRRAQWRFDYIAAENSMGFHAPQEAARILAEAIDYARQGQVAVVTGHAPSEAPSGTSTAELAPATDTVPTPTGTDTKLPIPPAAAPAQSSSR